MTRRMLLTISATALVALAVSQAASAQSRYDFKMPNAFVANGKTLAAGGYSLSVNAADDVVTVTPTDTKGESVILPVQTRVAERQGPGGPEVIFDKLDGQLYLSELLIPGADGYLLHATKAKHTHESLKGSPAKK
jgi:hypothetical protein